MFLDDQLYQKVKSSDIKESKDFQILVNGLYRICEDYFKPKLNSEMSFGDVTSLLDKTFKLWDMFIARLDKEDWVFTDVLKEYPYKKEFMDNPKLKEIYEKGK